MKLKSNYALIGFKQEIRNLLMASYVVTLALGHTLKCMSIKADTMIRYLNAAEELSIPKNIINLSLNFMGKRSHFIEAIIKESKRWEEMPNRKEPLTEEMILYIIKKSKEEDNDNGIYHAMADWLIMGIQTGCRKSEWSQDKTELNKTKDVHKNIDGSTTAFTANDFQFKGKNSNHLHVVGKRSRPALVELTWRFQKNNDNGQKITFAKSQSNSKLCFVEAAKRVVIRAKDLKVSNDKPIAIFTESKNDKTFKYINDGHVTKLLREAAKEIYNIKCTKALSKFTPHSIRVGACVKIHEEGGDATFIQTRLRWRSLAFMLYLRNTAKLATMQSKLIDNANNNI